jgi:hypothetical protein
MPARVGIPQRIVARVAVPIQALRVARVGHDGVGLGKAGVDHAIGQVARNGGEKQYR